MHLAGATYRQISQRLNFASEAGARMAVNRYYARYTAGVEERRAQHSARLETLIAAHWEAAALTAEQVEQVAARLAEGESATALAREFGVSVATVYNTRSRAGQREVSA
jgi:DNA invertase Pin-like site-specific DNA recombinase